MYLYQAAQSFGQPHEPFTVVIIYCFYIALEDFSFACEQNIIAETKNLFGDNNSKKNSEIIMAQIF